MQLTRRQAFVFLSAGGAWLLGCTPDAEPVRLDPKLPAQIPGGEPKPASKYADSVDALFDVLLPAEGEVPGSREAGADLVLRSEGFLALAIGQGLVRPFDDTLVRQLDDLSGTVRALLNRRLDALATLERPLTAFDELPSALQVTLVARLFDEDASRPLMLVIRAVAFTAFLGAVHNDLGLRAVGFPAFESNGLAVSGYPRMTNGRVDDYTFNRAPAPTPGDDLTLALDPGGDLR